MEKVKDFTAKGLSSNRSIRSETNPLVLKETMSFKGKALNDRVQLSKY